MNRGWWKLNINVCVNGIEVDFEDELSTETKRQIMKMIAAGCVAGEFEEPDSRDDTEREESNDENIPLF